LLEHVGRRGEIIPGTFDQRTNGGGVGLMSVDTPLPQQILN